MQRQLVSGEADLKEALGRLTKWGPPLSLPPASPNMRRHLISGEARGRLKDLKEALGRLNDRCWAAKPP